MFCVRSYWLGLGVCLALFGLPAPMGMGQDFLGDVQAKLRDVFSKGAGDSSKPNGDTASGLGGTQPPQTGGRGSSGEEALPPPKAKSGTVTPGAPNASGVEASSGSEGGFVLPPNARVEAPAQVPRIPYLGLVAENPPIGRTGLRVTQVTENSPAWKAGFRVNDRILAVEGNLVRDLDGLGEQLLAMTLGEPIRFLVQRDGRNRDVTAVLMDANIAAQTQPEGTLPYESADQVAGQAGQPPVLGLRVENLSDGFRRRFGIVAFRGAAVTEVDPGSPAQLAGIRPGDCIVEADGEILQSAVELQQWLMQRHAGESVSLGVYRARTLRQIQLTLGGQAYRGQLPSGQALNGQGPLLDPSNPLSGIEGGVPPRYTDPQYTAGLEEELQQVRQELEQTRRLLSEMENRLKRLENR